MYMITLEKSLLALNDKAVAIKLIVFHLFYQNTSTLIYIHPDRQIGMLGWPKKMCFHSRGSLTLPNPK